MGNLGPEGQPGMKGEPGDAGPPGPKGDLGPNVSSHFSHHPLPTLDEQLLVWEEGGMGVCNLMGCVCISICVLGSMCMHMCVEWYMQCKVVCIHKYMCFGDV